MRIAVLLVALWSCLAGTALAGGNSGFCEEPNVIIALDHSGSMLEDNKWSQAVNAMNLLGGNFQDSMRIGMMLFPWNGRCSVNRNQAVRTPCLPNNADNIRNQLQGSGFPPRSNKTPIARAINEAAAYLDDLNDPGRRSSIVLVTDGRETCDGNPSAAARNAFSREYPVFVIGFGRGVSRNSLNNIAREGGTGNPHFVDNEQQLFMALEEIANRARQEVCDGQDNDCDGLIDEGVMDEPCQTDCGPGIRRCLDGRWTLCAGGDIPDEECNGIDDDCDGEVDEFVQLPCTTVSGNPGFNDCLNGELDDECTPEDPDREEVCDGIDNDQDGLIDEGTEQVCSIDCHDGRRICVDGNYLSCTAPPVTEETCNGLDDDCDGLIDEQTECVGNEVCGFEGLCLRPCLQGECPEGFVCAGDQYCHPKLCDPICQPGQVCIREQCYDACVVGMDCGMGERCDGGLCVPLDSSGPGAPNGPATMEPNPNQGGTVFMTPGADDEGDDAEEVDDVGCNCDVQSSTSGWEGLLFLVLLVGLRRRRA